MEINKVTPAIYHCELKYPKLYGPLIGKFELWAANLWICKLIRM